MGFNYLLLFIECQQTFIIWKDSVVKFWIEKMVKAVGHELKPQIVMEVNFQKDFYCVEGK